MNLDVKAVYAFVLERNKTIKWLIALGPSYYLAVQNGFDFWEVPFELLEKYKI